MAAAIIQKTSRADAKAVNQKIKVAVAVQVNQHGSGRELSGAGHTRCLGNILELPSAQVAEELVRVLRAAEINVAPAVAVHVPQGDPGTVLQDLVVERERF
jgi:hypothetical protein